MLSYEKKKNNINPDTITPTPTPTPHTRYLICAPVPHSYDGHPKYHSWPWNIPSDSISEDVEGVCLRGVASGADCQVVPLDYGRDGIHVLLCKALVASDFSKR